MERLDSVKMVQDLIDAGMSKDKAVSYVSNTYKVDSVLLYLIFSGM
jgi:hypothetical protein